MRKTSHLRRIYALHGEKISTRRQITALAQILKDIPYDISN